MRKVVNVVNFMPHKRESFF